MAAIATRFRESAKWLVETSFSLLESAGVVVTRSRTAMVAA